MQINLEANNQSAHTLPKMGLKGLVRPCNNWQRNILLRFCRSSCFFNSGRGSTSLLGILDTHDALTGLAQSDIKTSQPLKSINVKSCLKDLRDPLKDDFLLRENENAELA